MKKIIAFVLAVVTMFSLVACGASKEPTADNKETPASGEKQVVKVIVQGDGIEPYLEKMAANLAAAGSPYTYEVERVALENLDEKINLAHASGEDYDLIYVNNSSVMQFVNAGVLEPLTGFLEDNPDIEANYSKALLNVGSVDGTLYALPFAPDARVLAYNKHILEDAGYTEAPKTQEEIMEIAKAVTKDGIYAFSRQMNTTFAPAYNEGCFLHANGAAVAKFAEDGSIKATCNEQAMIDSVQYWQDMMPYCPADINMSDVQCRAMFDQGRLAFYVFGPWEFSCLETMKFGDDYGLIVTPGSAGFGATTGGWYLGVGADAPCKEGAMAIMQEMIRPENLVTLGAGLSADNRCYEMAPFNTPEYAIFQEAMQYAAVPFPITASYNEMNDVFFEYFNKCTFGGADVTETMNECNEKIQELFDAEQ